MIVLCELLESGRVERHPAPPVSDELAWLRAQAWNWRQAGKTRLWIERRERPASFPTIEQQERWELRTAGWKATKH
jgi:hypothetical protein